MENKRIAGMKRSDKDDIVVMSKYGSGFLYLALVLGFFLACITKTANLDGPGKIIIIRRGFFKIVFFKF